MKIKNPDNHQETNSEDYVNEIPVTIISGFLGSGKTTLLNNILREQEGIKTAVLVNEFGSVGIDNELIISTSDDMIELNNGCICCSINGELVEAIKKIINSKKPIDYIVVETTGLADPLPVAMAFHDPEVNNFTRLDSIITMIDAENFNNKITDTKVGKAQVIYGDILLLNKCDLVTERKRYEIEELLKDIKRDARIIQTINGKVSLPLIMSVGLFQTDKLQNHANTHKHQAHEHQAHEHAHEHESSIEGFTSFSYESENPFYLRKFQNFLDNQLPQEIYRAKGILWFKESPIRHIFHLAGKRFSLNDSYWLDKKKNKIVFIGRRIDKDKLFSQMQACESNCSEKDSDYLNSQNNGL